jgi:dTDP-4-amino-4,6-dideoxygalactose transaminase
MDKKYAWPSFSAGESKIVSDVLLSNKVNYLFGDNGAKFEKGFSDFSQTKYALAVANGTLALDLCLRSLHLKKGMKFWLQAEVMLLAHLPLLF